jgi:hypothetical protein
MQTLSLGQTPPSSCSTLVLKNYISSIHTRPERITQSFQSLTAQKILWGQKEGCRMADLTGQLDEPGRCAVPHHLDDLYDLVERQLHIRKDRPGECSISQMGTLGICVRSVLEVPSSQAPAFRARRLPPPFGKQALQRVCTVVLTA